MLSAAIGYAREHNCSYSEHGLTLAANGHPVVHLSCTVTPVELAPPLLTASVNVWNACGLRADDPGAAVCFGDPFKIGSAATGFTVVDVGLSPNAAVWATTAPFLAIGADGMIYMRGDSPYWYDQGIDNTQVTNAGPWSDATANNEQIFGIYQPDGGVYEIRLRMTSERAVVVQPIGVPAPR